MTKYKCKVCDWVYDESKGDSENGLKPGTKFSDLPEDWSCPQCGAGKEFFVEV